MLVKEMLKRMSLSMDRLVVENIRVEVRIRKVIELKDTLILKLLVMERLWD